MEVYAFIENKKTGTIHILKTDKTHMEEYLKLKQD